MFLNFLHRDYRKVGIEPSVTDNIELQAEQKFAQETKDDDQSRGKSDSSIGSYPYNQGRTPTIQSYSEQ